MKYIFAIILLLASLIIAFYHHLESRFTQPVTSSLKTAPGILANFNFTVPQTPGIQHKIFADSGAIVIDNTQSQPTVNINLCEHKKADGSIINILGGLSWQQILHKIQKNYQHNLPAHAGLKNPLLDSAAFFIPAFSIQAYPQYELTDQASPNGRLQLTLLESSPIDILSDEWPEQRYQSSSQTDILFWHQLWLLWDKTPNQSWQKALHIQRIPHPHCQYGTLRFNIKIAATPQPTSTLYYYPFPLATAKQFRLKPGIYQAQNQQYPIEDAKLFKTAMQQGLIRHQPTGLLQLAPSDLPYMQQLNYPSTWPVLTPPIKETYKTLYDDRNGRYVRRQIQHYNNQQLLSAFRIAPHSSKIASWYADFEQQQRLRLSTTMPILSTRLFTTLPQGWQPWQRISHWPATSSTQTTIRYHLELPHKSSGRETINILVIGQKPEIIGAKRLFSDKKQALGYYLQLRPLAGRKTMTIITKPRAAHDLFRYEFSHIVSQQNTLDWIPAPLPTSNKNATMPINIYDHQGNLLLTEHGIKPNALQQGLGVLLGLHPHHRQSLWGIFQRAYQQPVNARLSLNLSLQTAAHQALSKHMPSVTTAWKKDRYQAKRFASVVVINANTGAILAIANYPDINADADWDELQAFNVSQIHGWQHDGSNRHAPGSTFKLISALTLEKAAVNDPAQQSLLAGTTPEQINIAAQQGQYRFATNRGCYPAYPGCKGLSIHNFNHQTIEQKLDHQQFGLIQAIQHSVNTWFAWQIERIDPTLLARGDIAGIPHAHSLTRYQSIHPLNAMANAFGFERAYDLSSGLLPADFVWSKNDVLITTPSHIDAYHSRHNIRQAALGLRIQTTPLQMAVIAASIASHKIIQPYLLENINGQQRKATEFPTLIINTQRLRQGMKRVPVNGTAARAFSNKTFDSIRPSLYAKTGTASITGRQAPYLTWLVGWLDAKTLNPEQPPLAFGCMISHSARSGGRECGPVVANFIKTLQTQTEVTYE